MPEPVCYVPQYRHHMRNNWNQNQFGMFPQNQGGWYTFIKYKKNNKMKLKINEINFPPSFSEETNDFGIDPRSKGENNNKKINLNKIFFKVLFTYQLHNRKQICIEECMHQCNHSIS